MTNIPPENIVIVGAPTGGSEIELIQSKLNKAIDLGPKSEVRFMAGETNILTNGSTTAAIPELLSFATNLWVNGNGCQNPDPKSAPGFSQRESIGKC